MNQRSKVSDFFDADKILPEPEGLTGPWTAALIEVGSAAIAACLPTLPPVWHRLRRTKLRSGPSSRATTSSDSRQYWHGGVPCSVLTIGRISAGNLESRRRITAAAAAESGSVTEIELDRTGVEFCRTESPEPVSPRLSSQPVKDGGGSKEELEARWKEEAV